MGSINLTPQNFSARLQEIDSALNDNSRKIRIRDNLEIANKENGFVWFCKVVVLPIVRLFGGDTFLHTRVDKVISNLLIQWTIHQHSLDEQDKDRLQKIINTLDQKTKQHYQPITTLALTLVDPTKVKHAIPQANSSPVIVEIPTAPPLPVSNGELAPPPPPPAAPVPPPIYNLNRPLKIPTKTGNNKPKHQKPSGKRPAPTNPIDELKRNLKNGNKNLRSVKQPPRKPVNKQVENPWGVKLKRVNNAKADKQTKVCCRGVPPRVRNRPLPKLPNNN